MNVPAFIYQVESVTTSADLFTPVSLFSRLRQLFPEALLLESGDYRGAEGSRSYLCAEALARFSVEDGVLHLERPDHTRESRAVTQPGAVVAEFTAFQASLAFAATPDCADMLGWFGYLGYSALPYLEKIAFPKPPAPQEDIPALQYALYRYVLRFDHFHNTLTILRMVRADATETGTTMTAPELLARIERNDATQYPFHTCGPEDAEISDADFVSVIARAQHHIQRGDVFQVVPSRKFRRAYRGDEFQVYRALRSVNPSPFMFFYDYGAFSLFGSSPEAQLLVQDGTAHIHPIAGTLPRGADAASDQALAARLARDPKETAEHVMLVDLARNDLYRHCVNVRVESYQEIQFFSHVIHLVSQVAGDLRPGVTALQVLADAAPAGTLSGAPKHRAMQLIHEWEPTPRSFYGGALGFLGADGSCLHAIMIRTFLARGRTLIYQAGAGIVASSVAENEVLEVAHKLGALRRAIELQSAEC